MFLFRTILKHIWPHIMKHKWSFWSLFVLQSARVFSSAILPPLVLKKIIDLISDSSITDHLQKVPLLFDYISYLIIIIVSGYIVARVSGYLVVQFQANVIRDLHAYAFEKLTKHSYNFFTNQFVGGLVAKAKRFVRGFEVMHDIFLYEFFMTFFSLIGIFYVLFREVPAIALTFLLWGFLYIAVMIIFVKFKMKYDLLEAEADSRVGGSLADVISNILTVKIFSARQKEIITYSHVINSERTHRLRAWHLGNIQDATQGLLMISINILILFQLADSWSHGLITAGVFVLVQSYMLNLFDKLWGIVKSVTKFMKALTDVKEMTDLFGQKLEIADGQNPQLLAVQKGEIAFTNVSFKYIEGVNVFDTLNLTIKSGEKVGLVGHSGSGKSTITKLLLRFADVSDGSIAIDGQDIRSITQDDLRSVISYVPQESILFHRTIKENISYGKPDARDEEIIEVAKKAHAHEFISKLPNGYNTLVGERGVKLSGGERQRVAIARAMLKQAPILVLDEATSSLDSISEQYIQEAFNELMKGKTTIVIAHRLSTIQKMDRIIVLEEGKIVEEGTHLKLIKKNGYYADLWNHQVGGFIE